jgi:multiple sugar transport system ATP-binding protein
MNLFDARREGAALIGAGFRLDAMGDVAGEVKVGLRPQDLTVSGDGPFEGEVEAVERLGFDGYAFLKTAAGPLAARFDGSVSVDVGQTVRVKPSGDVVHVFSADGARALRHPEARR